MSNLWAMMDAARLMHSADISELMDEPPGDDRALTRVTATKRGSPTLPVRHRGAQSVGGRAPA